MIKELWNKTKTFVKDHKTEIIRGAIYVAGATGTALVAYRYGVSEGNRTAIPNFDKVDNMHPIGIPIKMNDEDDPVYIDGYVAGDEQQTLLVKQNNPDIVYWEDADEC